MQPLKQLLQLAPHLERIFPVVGGAGAIFGERADEGAVLNAGHIARVGTGIKAAGPLLLVEASERAAGHQLVAKLVVLFLGAVDPMNRRGRQVPPSSQPSAADAYSAWADTGRRDSTQLTLPAQLLLYFPCTFSPWQLAEFVETRDGRRIPHLMTLVHRPACVKWHTKFWTDYDTVAPEWVCRGELVHYVEDAEYQTPDRRDTPGNAIAPN